MPSSRIEKREFLRIVKKRKGVQKAHARLYALFPKRIAPA